MSEQPDEKTLAMVKEAASLMGKLFIHRRDRKAVFRPDRAHKWHWTAVEERFTMDDFVNHLTDAYCLGTYLLNDDSTVKFLAFDLDLSKQGWYLEIFDQTQFDTLQSEGFDWSRYGSDLGTGTGNLEASLHDAANPAHRWARAMLINAVRLVDRAVKANLQLPTMTVITGGGAHVLVPFPEPMPAIDARSAGIEIVSGLPSITKVNDQFYSFGESKDLTIEVFPKQDSMDGKSFGNLIRLPFGWHHEAMIRTYTIDPEAVASPLWEWPKAKSLASLRALAQQTGVA